MSAPELTPWFDGATQKPKRRGVYMLMSGSSVGYQYWDGALWYPWRSDAERAAADHRRGMPASRQYQCDNWRGLAAPSPSTQGTAPEGEH